MFCFGETLQLLWLSTSWRASPWQVILAEGVSSDKDAVHASFWNWMAMSLVCCYFPRHFCNCHSQNALWFLLLCRAAMCYWLHVRNHSAHLLCKTTKSHIPKYIVCLLFLKAWSISIFILIWLWKYDRVMKADIQFQNLCLNFIFVIWGVIQPLWLDLSSLGVLNDVLSLLC